MSPTTRRDFGALAAAATLSALVPATAAAAPRPHHPRRGRLIASDSFRHGLGQWSAELESGGSVTASHGVLDIDVPGGATVWFRQPLRGPYLLEYTATPVSAGGANDRVSDLNNFWNASDVRSPATSSPPGAAARSPSTTTSRRTTRATARTTTPRPVCGATSARPASAPCCSTTPNRC